MSPFAKPTKVGGIGIFFPGENQNDFSPLTSERHPGREGIFPRSPADVNIRGFIDPRPRLVKSLVTK
jgi:hypothetical protein